jgi:hypothetical protein
VYDAYAYSVPLRIRREDLVAAAEEWQKDIAAFPER